MQVWLVDVAWEIWWSFLNTPRPYLVPTLFSPVHPYILFNFFKIFKYALQYIHSGSGMKFLYIAASIQYIHSESLLEVQFGQQVSVAYQVAIGAVIGMQAFPGSSLGASVLVFSLFL